MNNNWEVKIVDPVAQFGKMLFVVRRSHDARTEVLLSDGKTKVYDAGMGIDPSLFLDEDAFKALVDAIHKDYKPSEGKFTEGKLDATERHLEDLRHLLKLK